MTKIRLMKVQPNLQLRKIGNKYMIVSTASGNVNMTDVFTLNETAARLWQLMEGKDITPKELAVLLCNEYEVGEEDALKDVEKQLCEWKQSGLVG